jgi:hypothetical protein
MTYNKNKNGYNSCGVYDDNGRQRGILVGRAIASTIYGPPPTPVHTADHKDKNRGNDIDDNVRWATGSEQNNNREMPETLKTALIVVKNEIEKTAEEWVEQLKEHTNHMGREYTINMIKHYAQRKQHGFSYKEYPDLPGEMWKEIIGSNTNLGYWKISDMCRVKYITKYAENVLSGDRIGLMAGYPKVKINGKSWHCHILAFMTFSPEEYAVKKPGEMVLHEDDDKMDFRPHKLRIGSRKENGSDAHANGCYDGTKTERSKCMSYINGFLEKEHESQRDAMRYLRSKGYEKADYRSIGKAFKSKTNFAYDRTWKLIQ